MRAIELYEYHETKEVTPSPEIIQKIKKDCAFALKGSRPIYRGMETHLDFMYSNTPEIPRESANTHNYYTILMDELPSWSSFPKRSLSWICSTSRFTASDYGNLFRVLPVGNPDIVIADKEDLWFSFIKGLSLISVELEDMDEFNQTISIIINKTDNQPPKTLKSLASIIDQAAHNQQNGSKIVDEWSSAEVAAHELLNEVNQKGGFVSLMNNVLDPELNDFYITKLNNLYDKTSEVWFSGPAYFLSLDIWNNYFE